MHFVEVNSAEEIFLLFYRCQDDDGKAEFLEELRQLAYSDEEVKV